MAVATIKLEKGERVVELSIDRVRLDGGTQSRAELDSGVIAEYAEILDSMPLVVVFFDGSHYWLASGFHRLHAHRHARRKMIQCRVRTGTVRDALLFSVACNADHGLRRTPEDKRHAVRLLLSDGEWWKWSDREIARQCKVGHPLVGDVRRIIKEERKNQKQRAAEQATRRAEERKRTEEEKAKTEKAALKADFSAGKNGEQSAVTGRDSSEKSSEEGRRSYTTKHGTKSTMDTSRVNRNRDRHAIVIEREPKKIEELDRQILRSRKKYIVQEKRRGRTLAQVIAAVSDLWETIPVAEE